MCSAYVPSLSVRVLRGAVVDPLLTKASASGCPFCVTVPDTRTSAGDGVPICTTTELLARPPFMSETTQRTR